MFTVWEILSDRQFVTPDGSCFTKVVQSIKLTPNGDRLRTGDSELYWCLDAAGRSYIQVLQADGRCMVYRADDGAKMSTKRPVGALDLTTVL